MLHEELQHTELQIIYELSYAKNVCVFLRLGRKYAQNVTSYYL